MEIIGERNQDAEIEFNMKVCNEACEEYDELLMGCTTEQELAAHDSFIAAHEKLRYEYLLRKRVIRCQGLGIRSITYKSLSKRYKTHRRIVIKCKKIRDEYLQQIKADSNIGIVANVTRSGRLSKPVKRFSKEKFVSGRKDKYDYGFNGWLSSYEKKL